MRDEQNRISVAENILREREANMARMLLIASLPHLASKGEVSLSDFSCHKSI